MYRLITNLNLNETLTELHIRRLTDLKDYIREYGIRYGIQDNLAPRLYQGGSVKAAMTEYNELIGKEIYK